MSLLRFNTFNVQNTLPKYPPWIYGDGLKRRRRFCRHGRALKECDRRGHHPSLLQPSDDGGEGYEDGSEGEGRGLWQGQAPPPPPPPSPSENDNLLLKVFYAVLILFYILWLSMTHFFSICYT